MSRSEFRYNKKRKHFAYLFKDIGSKRKNLLLSSKPIIVRLKKGKIKKTNNIPLYKHPNPNKNGQYYLIARIYIDDLFSFDDKIYRQWRFDKNDKRKVKRLKKML